MTDLHEDHPVTAFLIPESQQVSFWAVHEFVQKYLDTVENYPAAGTPAWCELDSADRRKWAALLDYSQHFALRVETCQEAEAEASHDVSAAADWAAIAQAQRNRADWYAERPWMKRGAA